MEQHTKPLLPLFAFLQEGLRELWLTVLRQAEFPQHFRGERAFSVPLCLERSGW